MNREAGAVSSVESQYRKWLYNPEAHMARKFYPNGNETVASRAMRSAMRCLTTDATKDPQRVADYVKGYMAGHAAVVRESGKRQRMQPL